MCLLICFPDSEWWQNDAAEFLRSELPNEDASQKHSDICCVVKCCYCCLLWRWICFLEDIKQGIESWQHQGGRGGRRRERRPYCWKSLWMTELQHLGGIWLHSLSKYLCSERPHRCNFAHSVFIFSSVPLHLTLPATAVTTETGCFSTVAPITPQTPKS